MVLQKRLCLVVFVFVVCVTHLLGQDVGNATYYHRRFHLHRTADGGVHHKDSMMCAHKTYPFGTLLQVRNLRNNKKVIVKVTDRGPFGKRYIIDLSLRAAREIDMIRHGVVKVEVSVYRPLKAPFKKGEKPPLPAKVSSCMYKIIYPERLSGINHFTINNNKHASNRTEKSP